jgi:hypothetical protein
MNGLVETTLAQGENSDTWIAGVNGTVLKRRAIVVRD